MKRGVILFALLIYYVAGFPVATEVKSNEKFYFNKRLDNANEVEVVEQLIESNYLGDQIARKLYIVQKLYTYEVEGTATSPGIKIVVEKPYIYYSLKILNNHFKKAVKKNEMSQQDAVEKFSNYLDIGISIVYQPTSEFENELQIERKPDYIISVFNQVILQ